MTVILLMTIFGIISSDSRYRCNIAILHGNDPYLRDYIENVDTLLEQTGVTFQRNDNARFPAEGLDRQWLVLQTERVQPIVTRILTENEQTHDADTIATSNQRS